MMEILLGLVVTVAVVASVMSAGNIEYQHQRTKHGKSNIRIVEDSHREPFCHKINTTGNNDSVGSSDMADGSTVFPNKDTCI